MKRKLMYATLAIAGLFLGFGCSTDDTLTDYEVQQMINQSLNDQWTIVYISPQKNRAVKNKSYFYNCYGKEKEYYIENQG